MQIATKVWSDFSATIPLIRSFSLGYNFPPEYPLFAGPPIRYHFIFFLIVGFLEKSGIRLDWALNTLSGIGFFALVFLIYSLGKNVFKSKKVGVVCVLLFIFNGSLGFLEFFKNNHFSSNILRDIITNNRFTSFGPYDGKIVSAFWSLNIFTNQRHLALAYAAFLFLLYKIYFYSKNPQNLKLYKAIILGTVVGLFPFIHQAVFGMMGVILLTSLIIYPKIRSKILIVGILALVLAVPQYLYMGHSFTQNSLFHPGYLVQKLNVVNFIIYWLYNLGLTPILAILGLIFSDKDQRKIFFPFLALFVVGNLFQFTPEIAANHKFFNLFAIGANVFVAYFLVKLWNKKLIGKIVAPLLFLPLVLTGIIDFFPIVNDKYMVIEDIPNNITAFFIKEGTPPDAIFLNSSYIFNPASIAGRKIYMGWPYFAWSAGYDTNKRGKMMEKIYLSRNKQFTCNLLRAEKIDYFTVEDTSKNPDMPLIDLNYFYTNFSPEFKTGKPNELAIFSVEKNCFY